MGDMPIGVLYRCDNPPENLPAFARLVERLGYDEFWLVEECLFAGGVSAAAIAAASTENLVVGLGILPAAVRDPTLAAMELASLARTFPGRILPGFRHGVADRARRTGAGQPSPLAVLGETVETVRDLLAGRTVTRTGRHAPPTEVTLAFPPDEPPPIATGVRGEESLRLSGRVADGAILAEGASPARIRWARGLIDEGRRAAGRTGTHRLTVYADFDFDEALAGARREIATRILAAGQRVDPAGRTAVTGWLSPADADLDEEVSALLERSSDVDTLAATLPEHYLDRFAVGGSAQRCAASVRRLREAGADAVVLVPPRDPQFAVAQITLAAEGLLPLLRED